MPENNMAETEVGDELAQGGNMDNEAAETEGQDDTYFLPKEVLGGQPFKAGEILKFKVIGEDEDGQIQVECLHGNDAKGESKLSWQDDVRASVTPEGGSQPPPQSY